MGGKAGQQVGRGGEGREEGRRKRKRNPGRLEDGELRRRAPGVCGPVIPLPRPHSKEPRKPLVRVLIVCHSLSHTPSHSPPSPFDLGSRKLIATHWAAQAP